LPEIGCRLENTRISKNIQIKDNNIQIREDFVQFERITLAHSDRFLETVSRYP
jgi:hypothetical protein